MQHVCTYKNRTDMYTPESGTQLASGGSQPLKAYGHHRHNTLPYRREGRCLTKLVSVCAHKIYSLLHNYVDAFQVEEVRLTLGIKLAPSFLEECEVGISHRVRAAGSRRTGETREVCTALHTYMLLQQWPLKQLVNIMQLTGPKCL